MSKLSAKAYLQQTHQCHYCNGTGKVHPNNIEDDCGMCDGRGPDWPIYENGNVVKYGAITQAYLMGGLPSPTPLAWYQFKDSYSGREPLPFPPTMWMEIPTPAPPKPQP